jgi:protein SCO1/2
MSQTPAKISPENGTSALPAQTSRLQRIITLSLWSILFLVVLMVLVGKLLPGRHADVPVLFQAARFALIDQDGKGLSAADLRGSVYICDFIFTTCGSACPLMSHDMADIQKQTPASVQLLSFTVNPEHDTPAVLKEYAASYGANPSRWHFLTGTPGQMSQAAVEMKIQKPDEPNPTVAHSERFFLVDGDGNVRGMYNREDPDAMKTLVADATWLAGTKGARGW